MMMALEPTIFMFDEPTAGMSVDEVPVVLDLIARLKTDKTKTILLVEHKMDVVRSLADRIIVLTNGQLAADGEPAAVIASPVVQEAYLGVSPGREHERRAHASRRAHPYRPLSHPAGRGLGRAGGPDDHAARPQRRRQDDHAPHHHGPVAGLEGTDRARRDAAREHGRERCRAAWRRLCAGDDGGVLRSHGQGEPGARRARPPARRRASRLDLRLLSGAEEILAVARRGAVGRAEADAVDRPRDRRAARTPA